jgi:hypothetical protein
MEGPFFQAGVISMALFFFLACPVFIEPSLPGRLRDTEVDPTGLPPRLVALPLGRCPVRISMAL